MSPSEDLTIIISTMNGILNEDIARFNLPGVKYLVVNQGIPLHHIRNKNVRVINDSGVGLSRSRNIGLRALEEGSNLLFVITIIILIKILKK